MNTLEKHYEQQRLLHRAAFSAKTPGMRKIWVDKWSAIKDKIKKLTIEEAELEN